MARCLLTLLVYGQVSEAARWSSLQFHFAAVCFRNTKKLKQQSLKKIEYNYDYDINRCDQRELKAAWVLLYAAAAAAAVSDT